MNWSFLRYSADDWAAGAFVAALIFVAWLLTSPLAPDDAALNSEVDGIRVRLDKDDEWTVTMSARCPLAAELFAHRPMASFDRPLRALFGPLRRLEAPASFGPGWAFYGASAPAAREIAARLPAPGGEFPWTRIELRGGVLEASFSAPGNTPPSRLQDEADAFRALLGAVRGA